MAYRQVVKTKLVIDIETIPLPVSQEEINSFIADWKPPGNYKDPEKIEAARLKALETATDEILKDKCFSIDGKRMICCALGIADEDENKVVRIESWAGEDLSEITHGVADYINAVGPYQLIGWNHENFDVPELMKAFRLTGARLHNKPSKWDYIDLCKVAFYRMPLKKTAKAFGLKTLDVSGDDVHRLYQEGRWDDIKKYNEHDIYLTGELFLAASMWRSFN